MATDTWTISVTCGRCTHQFNKSPKGIRFAPGIRRVPQSDYLVHCPNCQNEIAVPSDQIPQDIRAATIRRRYRAARYSTP